MASDETGYDYNDPKHPDFHSRVSELWDLRDKTVPGFLPPVLNCEQVPESDEVSDHVE